MTYRWYLIMNLDDFLALGVPSHTLSVLLENNGKKTIMITHGNEIGVQVDNSFHIMGLNHKNPSQFSPNAVFLDIDRNLWLGLGA